ncbi:Cytoskeleton protein rodZ [Providencia stuartii]|nr:Cytoskeleton protein rodZ [Providencia stuartii]
MSVDRTQSTEEPVATPVVQDALTMSFKGSCWLEVRDANNKVLYSGIKNSGDTLDLQGKLALPLEILVRPQTLISNSMVMWLT